MHRRQKQPVRRKYPQKRHTQQNQCQPPDFSRRDGENVADQILIEFCKAAAAERRDKNTECARGRLKYPDVGCGRLRCAAAHERKQQRKQNGQSHRPADRLHRAAENTDGNAGEA